MMWKESKDKECGGIRWKVRHYFKQLEHRMFLNWKHHNHQSSTYCSHFIIAFFLRDRESRGNFALSWDLLWERQKGTEAEKGNTSQLSSGGWGASTFASEGWLEKKPSPTLFVESEEQMWVESVGQHLQSKQEGRNLFIKTERLAIACLLIIWLEDNIV